ncbi:MAG TPA: O-antigen ligase family protein [Pseudomonadota bacterium]|nr:O-antigen ligase family protein [Pseudomonadota bacterium]
MKYSATAQPHATPIRRGGIPVPMLALAGGLLASYLPMIMPSLAGISFLGWMLPLAIAAVHLLMYVGRMKFPLMLWAPWIAWVAGYTVLAEAPNALQRGIMLLTPLIVAAAFSTLRPTADLLNRIDRWIKIFLWVFLAAAGIATGLLSSGVLYDTTNFAAGSITASLLACWFATRYVLMRQWRDLLLWLIMAAVPVLANTRTGMVAVALTLPLVLAPWSVLRRLLLLAALPAVGLALFQTERIQKKMFYSGRGTVDDAMTAVYNMFTGEDHVEADFATSGRAVLNMALRRGLDDAYFFGHGANTTEAISLRITRVAHPHNDWLRLRYEYGLIGTLLFAATMLIQTWHGWRAARRVPSPINIHLYVGVSAFLPMAIFMLSDNVILYVAWFGNLQFALLGLGYAIAHQVRMAEMRMDAS